MRKRVVILSSLLFLSAPLICAKYKIKEIPLQPARECSAHQDFQNVVIGASPCETREKMLELFDAPKLHEQKIMPVLIVIENQNDFALRIHEKDIFLIDSEGRNVPTISYAEVLLRITLNKPLGSYSTRRDILLRSVRNKDMLLDFETKAFGEKLIAPRSSDRGVIFFPLPEDGDVAGIRLYLPTVLNITEDRELMFFEFELGRATP